MRTIEKTEFNGLKPVSCNYTEAVGCILKALDDSRKKVFIHLNFYNYYILKKKARLTDIIIENTLPFIEGIGMKAVACLKGWGVLDDVNGTDLFPILLDKLIHKKYSVFLLGATDDVIKEAAYRIRKKYHYLDICGFHNGYFAIDDEQEIIGTINKSGARLLLLGMGMEKEAAFLNRNYSMLDTKVIWAVGGLFDFISGRLPRAPLFLRKIRLEWLFRMIMEPGKKAGRLFIFFFWFLFSFNFKKR